MAGISEPGLIASGFWIHRRRFSGVFSAAPEAMVARLIRCVRSGPKRPFAAVPRDRVAVDAGGGFEDSPAGSRACRPRVAGSLLRANPRVEILAAVHRDAQQHLGVLGPAILRALAEKDARCGAGRSTCCSTRFGIRSVLPAKLRNPEAVVGVGGKQLQECRRRMSGVAHRNVQLVRGDDAEPRIAELPPELVPDGGDLERGRRLGSILNRVDHPRRSQKQDTTTIRTGMMVQASSICVLP